MPRLAERVADRVEPVPPRVLAQPVGARVVASRHTGIAPRVAHVDGPIALVARRSRLRDRAAGLHAHVANAIPDPHVAERSIAALLRAVALEEDLALRGRRATPARDEQLFVELLLQSQRHPCDGAGDRRRELLTVDSDVLRHAASPRRPGARAFTIRPRPRAVEGQANRSRRWTSAPAPTSGASPPSSARTTRMRRA